MRKVLSHKRARHLLYIPAEDLTSRQQLFLANHLAGCPECQAYASDLRVLQRTLVKAMHTRWDSQRLFKKSSSEIQRRWKETQMKKRSINLFSVLAGIGAVILFVLYGPALILSLLPLLDAIPMATAAITPTQPAPAETPAAPTVVEINAQSTLSAHDDPVWALDTSPDGTLLGTGGNDGTVKIWDLTNLQELLVITADAGIRGELSFSPDGALAAVSYGSGTTKIWDTSNGEEVLTLPGTSGATSNDFSPDGTQLAVGYKEHIARVWDLQTVEVFLTLSGHLNSVNDVDFSSDGKRLMTASSDGTAKIWDLETGAELLTLGKPGIPNIAAAFSPDGRRAVTGGGGAKAMAAIWDTDTGELLFELSGQRGRIWEAVFSPDGKFVATSGADLTPIIWDVSTGEQLMKLVGHSREVANLEFSPDGQSLLSASFDGTVKFWDLTPP
jgi:Tol biopolymer transport system component